MFYLINGVIQYKLRGQGPHSEVAAAKAMDFSGAPEYRDGSFVSHRASHVVGPAKAAPSLDAHAGELVERRTSSGRLDEPAPWLRKSSMTSDGARSRSSFSKSTAKADGPAVV